jgi:hypothetical protein
VLGEQEKQAILDAERYRVEVVRTLSGEMPKHKLAWDERIASFFETKVGFWLLTTLLAASLTALGTWIPTWMNKKEIEDKALAEAARRDTELLQKIAPTFLSADPTQFSVGLEILKHLKANRGANAELVDTIEKIISTKIIAGGVPGATNEVKIQASIAAAALDAPVIATTNNDRLSPELSAKPVTQVLPMLPPRIYIQISDEAQRVLAKRAAAILLNENMLVPGIELVTRGSPGQGEIRYCKEKVEGETVGRVAAALKGVFAGNGEFLPKELPPSLCRNVRMNHVELWFWKVG